MASDNESHPKAKAGNAVEDGVVEGSASPAYDPASTPPPDKLDFQYTDSQKIGITGAVFLIINKMIGTGIFSTPSGIFAATGSVGVCLFLWIIGFGPDTSFPSSCWLIGRR